MWGGTSVSSVWGMDASVMLLLLLRLAMEGGDHCSGAVAWEMGEGWALEREEKQWQGLCWRGQGQDTSLRMHRAKLLKLPVRQNPSPRVG